MMASLHIVKRELFDPDVMKSLLGDERFPVADRRRLRSYFKSRVGPNEVRVVYNYGKGYEAAELGRIYPDAGLGQQSFSREIRAALAARSVIQKRQSNTPPTATPVVRNKLTHQFPHRRLQ